MFPNLLRKQMLDNQTLLYDNNVKLISVSVSSGLVNGTPTQTTSETEHWSGKGSIQYVRPRIQKSIASETAGLVEDPIAIVCYLPYESMPTEGMVVVDEDGATGIVGVRMKQIQKPANVGGLNVYWELYLGAPVNV